VGEKISKAMLDDLVSKGATVGKSAAESPMFATLSPAFAAAAKAAESSAPKQSKGPNKLESSYASHLEILKRAGEIVDYKFESIKLKIGVKTCWYCCDFWVLAKDGVTEFHETKGPFARDDSMVKLKSAALQYPHFRFFLVRKDGKRFSVEAVK
jgi:hypothetical protein